LAALLVLHEQMDALYEKTAADAFTTSCFSPVTPPA
jgi:hypothetical protein